MDGMEGTDGTEGKERMERKEGKEEMDGIESKVDPHEGKEQKGQAQKDNKTPLKSVTKFNIIDQFHQPPQVSSSNRPVTAAVSKDGAKGTGRDPRPKTSPTRESKRSVKKSKKRTAEESPATDEKVSQKQDDGGRPFSPDSPGPKTRLSNTRKNRASSSATSPHQQEELPPLKHTHIAASQSVPNVGASMSALSALNLDGASLRLQKVDTLRTQQNVTLMQIVEIEKRLEEQRLEMLSSKFTRCVLSYFVVTHQ
jgi:hypothetical protein